MQLRLVFLFSCQLDQVDVYVPAISLAFEYQVNSVFAHIESIQGEQQFLPAVLYRVHVNITAS